MSKLLIRNKLFHEHVAWDANITTSICWNSKLTWNIYQCRADVQNVLVVVYSLAKAFKLFCKRKRKLYYGWATENKTLLKFCFMNKVHFRVRKLSKFCWSWTLPLSVAQLIQGKQPLQQSWPACQENDYVVSNVSK